MGVKMGKGKTSLGVHAKGTGVGSTLVTGAGYCRKAVEETRA